VALNIFNGEPLELFKSK